MSRLAGRRGRIYIGIASAAATAEPCPFINKFNIKRDTERFDVTAFEDSNKTYLAGLPDAQGDIGGYYDDATAQFYTAASDGAARKMYIYPNTSDTTKYFFTTALFDFNLDAAVDSAISITGSWAAATEFAKV